MEYNSLDLIIEVRNYKCSFDNEPKTKYYLLDSIEKIIEDSVKIKCSPPRSRECGKNINFYLIKNKNIYLPIIEDNTVYGLTKWSNCIWKKQLKNLKEIKVHQLTIPKNEALLLIDSLKKSNVIFFSTPSEISDSDKIIVTFNPKTWKDIGKRSIEIRTLLMGKFPRKISNISISNEKIVITSKNVTREEIVSELNTLGISNLKSELMDIEVQIKYFTTLPYLK
jgi:hypothetical protein